MAAESDRRATISPRCASTAARRPARERPRWLRPALGRRRDRAVPAALASSLWRATLGRVAEVERRATRSSPGRRRGDRRRRAHGLGLRGDGRPLHLARRARARPDRGLSRRRGRARRGGPAARAARRARRTRPRSPRRARRSPRRARRWRSAAQGAGAPGGAARARRRVAGRPRREAEPARRRARHRGAARGARRAARARPRRHGAARAHGRHRAREAQGGRRDRGAGRLRGLGRADPDREHRRAARRARHQRVGPREGAAGPARRDRARRLSRSPLCARAS